MADAIFTNETIITIEYKSLEEEWVQTGFKPKTVEEARKIITELIRSGLTQYNCSWRITVDGKEVQ